MGPRTPGRLAPLRVALAGAMLIAGCGSDDGEAGGVPVALLLSYTGVFAAASINSERAVMLALEEVNRGGGISGRPLRLSAHDIRDDGERTAAIIDRLSSEQQVAAFIGPDSPSVVNNLVNTHRDRTLFLPAVAVPARDYLLGASNWFTFAPSTWSLACAFQRRLREVGSRLPLILFNPDAFHAELGIALKMALGLPDRAIAIPARSTITSSAVEAVLAQRADALLLMAFPESASSMVSELAFRTSSLAGTRWFLSPTLHTDRFFQNVPPGPLQGALGLKPARSSGWEAFHQRFRERWQDDPLVEAYGFYDAAAVAALALQAAAIQQPGTAVTAASLARYVRPVAGPPGMPISWDQLGQGLELVRRGEDVDYQGVSGRLDFDASGDPAETPVQWWRVEGDRPVDEGQAMAAAVTVGSPCPP